jgi:FHA domain/von Willebrand factor type A domain
MTPKAAMSPRNLMSRVRVTAFFTLCALLALGGVAHAVDHLRLERIDLSKSPTMKAYLTLTDGDGRVMTGRGREDWKLVLDSAEQGVADEMQSFDASNEPINLVALVQVSQAMLEVSDDVKKGVKILANAMPPKSRMALLGFSSETKRLAELGPAPEAESAANQLQTDTEYVEVHLLDSIRTAIDILNAAPKDQRKIIVLFSDGIDVNMDSKTFLTVGKRALDAGIVIDTIGYAPFEPARLRNLSQLTKQSAGGDRTCKASADVTTEFQNVADELRKQYILTYELPIPGGDGKFHTFQVLGEAAGRAAYSNNIIVPVPKGVHLPKTKGGGRRWWLWALCIVGGLMFVMLIVWLIFRERDEAPVEFAASQPAAPQGKPRTMALDAAQGPGGKVSAVGWLVAVSGRQANKTFPLKSGRTVIGTAGECDIVIDDQFASTRHAEVRFEGKHFKIVDLGSTNGTTVNDKKIREHELVDNDRILFGRTELKFKSVVQ